MFFKALIICVLFSLLTGCGNLHTQKNENTLPQSEKAIVVENYDGYAGQGKLIKQTFTSVPQRVLAVSGSTLDNMIFLGLEKSVVAVSACTTDENYPEAKEYKPFRRLSERYPSKEAVLGLKPDMIISWGSLFGDSALGTVEYWHKKGVHTYIWSNTVPSKASGPRTLKNIIKDLENLSRIFHVTGQSAEKITKLEKRLDSLKKKKNMIPEGERPGIVTIQYTYGNEYFARSDMDMTTDIIRQAGGVSLDDKIGGKKSIEHLIQKNPDIIMIVDMPSRPGKAKIESLKKNPLLQQVTAVKNDNFFLIPYRAFYGGSVYTIQAAEDLNTFITKRF